MSVDAAPVALPTEQDARWKTVLDRDASADGRFYYSVATTGVYCRPSCPSRLARPEHVRFHATCEDAEKAGFRACLRCRPNESSIAEKNATVIAAVCRMIGTAEEIPTLGKLAAAADMSTFHFHRVFKSMTGLTPKAYAAAHRSRRVRDELARKGDSVTSAIYDAGFNSSGRFYETSNGVLGMTPTASRSGGRSAEIRFAVAQYSLGAILVACSAIGVCSILLGNDPDLLVKDLQDQFPRAELLGGDDEFEKTVARVVGFVEAPAIGLDLPLDVRGTAFQQRVWQALRTIPAGQTASYTDIAEKIGAPKAVRAVARACAANKIAIAIPCHRVVRHDGGLSGYRWGVDRKRALLVRETA